MKKFVVMHEDSREVKATFDDRLEARRWIAKNDKFGDYILLPMLIDEAGNMNLTQW